MAKGWRITKLLKLHSFAVPKLSTPISDIFFSLQPRHEFPFCMPHQQPMVECCNSYPVFWHEKSLLTSTTPPLWHGIERPIEHMLGALESLFQRYLHQQTTKSNILLLVSRSLSLFPAALSRLAARASANSRNMARFKSPPPASSAQTVIPNLVLVAVLRLASRARNTRPDLCAPTCRTDDGERTTGQNSKCWNLGSL